MSRPSQPPPPEVLGQTVTEASSSALRTNDVTIPVNTQTKSYDMPKPRSSDGIMKRTIEKLSFSAQSSHLSKSEVQKHSPGRKRLFSLTKRGKDEPTFRQLDSLDLANHNVSDSPFVRPPSPEYSSPRPMQIMLGDFEGTSSVHPGTQALLQAIQALPWTEEEEPEDGENTGESTDTDNEPVIMPSSTNALSQLAKSQNPHEASDIASRQDDLTPEEFRDNSARADIEVLVESRTYESNNQTSANATAWTPNHGLSLSQHKADLAGKLREAFEMDDILEVVAEIPCWMLRSILLQGFLYLTNAHICFFARIPSREEHVLKSGSLQKRARTKRLSKYWFILKNDALSWYNSSSDPYFPRGMIDLRYIASCDISGEKGLKLRTQDRVINLLADSTASRDEWMKAIQKVIFKTQNMGECVKIAIPYSLIIDVDKSSTMGFSELLEVKVVDKGVVYSVDSYYFAYFRDLPAVLEQIRDIVRLFSQLSPGLHDLEVKDSTAVRSETSNGDRIPSPDKLTLDRPSTFRLSSFLKPFSTFNTSSNSGHLESRDPLPTTISPVSINDRPGPCTSPSSKLNTNTNTNDSLIGSESLNAPNTGSMSSNHTYPPPPSPGTFPSGEPQGSWGLSVPSWLRVPGRRVLSGINLLNMSPSDDRVKEIYTPGSLETAQDANANMDFSVIEAKEGMDPEIVSKFHSSFALSEKENLLGVIPGYLFRALPVWGKFYISSSYLCFRSSKSLTKTRMIIPIKDILNSESAKGYRFGMFGLVVIIKGYEELFFEFGSAVRRDLCAELLRKQLDQIHLCQTRNEIQGSFIEAKAETLFLKGLEIQHPLARSDTIASSPSQTDSLPAVMFTSSSSTFLTFKPNIPLHFTFLTIGSRGDVQPYIALGKRLLQEGHRVRIATHGEFRSWIESHCLEFAYIGGDPAELMQLCVENGVFTVSFLKESAAKFRGWIDDLLKTSWEACQGTDVLIESPSAMGGIHIAEALKIPYFRAFTMPWSRTRAYPHAFAVPERKMGGSYNYMTYVLFDQVFWRGTSGQINRWRRKTLKLPSTNLDRMEQHKVPFLYNFSPFIVPPPLDWYEWIRVTGYWYLDDADVSANKWTPPTELLQFIDRTRALGKKLIYLGFGSIVVSDPEGMTKCVVEAIQNSGVHAVLSKGWSDRLSYKRPRCEEPREEFPDVIFPIASLPHDWLFSQIDAACHHGGAGTTGASLRAGIPTVIKPFFGDQFFWGDRVEALGIGTSVRKLTAESLTAALVTATTDAKQISRAKLVGQTIRSEDGVGKAVEAIYRDLEYARSFIKKDGVFVDAFEDSRPPSRGSGTQRSSGSVHPASEDWSVISEHNDRS